MSGGAKSGAGFQFKVGVNGNIDVNVLLAFLFGVIFLLVLLVFSIFFPNPTDTQIRFWITALALAAAGIGAVLPGFLEIKYKSIVRASGAIGLFVIVYLFQPAIERTVPTFPEPSQDPKPIALNLLALLDRGDPVTAFALFDPAGVRNSITVTEFSSLYQSARAPRGAAETRTLVDNTTALNPPGALPGRYRILGYVTKFKDDCRYEVVGLRATQNLSWSVSSYNISLASVPCS